MIKKTDIPNDTVTYAKMQNAEGANTVLGNNGSAGDPVKELSASDLAAIVDGELLIDEDDFASDTDTKAPTQQSTKAYVDGEISGISAPDVVLVETQTASSSSTIEFDLSSTYSRYEVQLTAVIPSSDNQFLNLRTSTDGGTTFDSGASDYEYVISSSDTSVAPTTTTRIVLAGNQTGTGTAEMVNGTLTAYNPSATTQTFFRFEYAMVANDGVLSVGQTVGRRESAADVDAIQFYFGSGNIASGTFKLYGYK